MPVQNIRVNRVIGPRHGQSDLRFVFHVVEGEGNDNPGRVRTIRLDANGGGEPWVKCDWEVKQGRRTRLKSASIDSDMAEKGAFFFTKEAYADDPNPTRRERGWDAWEDYNKRMANGQNVGHFPDNMLPHCVQELQGKTAKSKAKYVPPSLEEIEAEVTKRLDPPEKQNGKAAKNA